MSRSNPTVPLAGNVSRGSGSQSQLKTVVERRFAAWSFAAWWLRAMARRSAVWWMWMKRIRGSNARRRKVSWKGRLQSNRKDVPFDDRQHGCRRPALSNCNATTHHYTSAPKRCNIRLKNFFISVFAHSKTLGCAALLLLKLLPDCLQSTLAHRSHLMDASSRQ